MKAKDWNIILHKQSFLEPDANLAAIYLLPLEVLRDTLPYFL